LSHEASHTCRVATNLYPSEALLVAADRLSDVCKVEILERGDFIDVRIETTSELAGMHVVDEYLTFALIAMIERRSVA
jgi:hypothetical protein